MKLINIHKLDIEINKLVHKVIISIALCDHKIKKLIQSNKLIENLIITTKRVLKDLYDPTYAKIVS